jgi:hypothetical protein
MRLRHITSLLVLMASAASAAPLPPPRDIMEMFGIFDAMCIESNGNLTSEHPMLADMIKQKIAQEVEPNIWQFTLQQMGERHNYVLLQYTIMNTPMCRVDANHGSSADIRSTAEFMASRLTEKWGGTMNKTSKELMGHPDVVFDNYEITVPGKEHAAMISVSSTDKSDARPMRHAVAFSAAY